MAFFSDPTPSTKTTAISCLLKPFTVTGVLFVGLLLTAVPQQANASCSLKQTACEASCKISNINDTMGKISCLAQCKAERLACSAKESASDASEKTKGLFDN